MPFLCLVHLPCSWENVLRAFSLVFHLLNPDPTLSVLLGLSSGDSWWIWFQSCSCGCVIRQFLLEGPFYVWWENSKKIRDSPLLRIILSTAFKLFHNCRNLKWKNHDFCDLFLCDDLTRTEIIHAVSQEWFLNLPVPFLLWLKWCCTRAGCTQSASYDLVLLSLGFHSSHL